MTAPTNNNVPSNSVQDRLYNAEKFDEFMNSDNPNYTDRKGVSRWTLNGIRQTIQNWMGSLSTPSGANNIGLSNGGYVQNAIQYLTPQMFGGVGSLTVDNTEAVLACISKAKELGLAVDLCGGPWRVNETLDFTGIWLVKSDVSGRIVLNPTTFIPKHAARYAVTFGNPDTAAMADRHSNTTIIGTVFVASDNRTTALNGLFIKGALISADSFRVRNFNGKGIYLGAVWDSTFKSLSVEDCGNLTDYAFSIAAFGDTSNCLNIGRIQVEKARHKQFAINCIRSEIHTMHCEQLYVLSLDDGTTGLPSGLPYLNFSFLLSNCTLGQVFMDTAANTTEGTVTTVASGTMNLYASTVNAASMSAQVCTTYGAYSTLSGCFFNGYYNRTSSFKYSGCRFTNPSSPVTVAVTTGTFIECEIDTFSPYYATGIKLIRCTINNDLAVTSTPCNGVEFDKCIFMKDIRSTTTPTTDHAVTLNECTVRGSLIGAYQSKINVNGGYISTIALASRAYAKLVNVRAGSFDYTGDVGFITQGCNFTTVTKWNFPQFGSFGLGERTQRMDAMATGAVAEYINTVNQGVSFKALTTYSGT